MAVLIFNSSTIKSCLTKSLLTTVSLFGSSILAYIVGLVSLNRLSFAISKIPSLLSKDEGCGGFNKFPMPHKPPTVMKEMAIIAIMLFRIIFLLITPYFQFDQEIDGRKVRYAILQTRVASLDEGGNDSLKYAL